MEEAASTNFVEPYNAKYCEQDSMRCAQPLDACKAIPRIDVASMGEALLCKPPRAGAVLGVPATPAGLADDPSALALLLGSNSITLSQPNSATSSLASLLVDPDLGIASRQSSASDLGFQRLHLGHLLASRQDFCLSGRSDGSNSLSSRSDASSDDAFVALARFDSNKCSSLTPIHVTVPQEKHNAKPVTKSPHRDNAAKIVPVYRNYAEWHASPLPGLAVRAVRLTSTTNLPATSGTFNPYDSMRRNATSAEDTSLCKFKEGMAPINGPFLTADRVPDCMVLIPGIRRG